jgi:hypothetical protein
MVTEGMSVVDAINQVPVDTPGDGKPLQDVTLTVAQMIN